MNTERRAILELLKDGTINVQEAELLLDAIPCDATKAPPYTQAPVARHVVITVLESGFVKSNVRLPLALIKAGQRFGKSVSSLSGHFDVGDDFARVVETLKSINFDEVIAEVSSGIATLPYLLAEIDEGPRRTEITLQ